MKGYIFGAIKMDVAAIVCTIEGHKEGEEFTKRITVNQLDFDSLPSDIQQAGQRVNAFLTDRKAQAGNP